MTRKEIRTLRDKIGTDPILTDEEIEYIWIAMDKQEVEHPIREKLHLDWQPVQQPVRQPVRQPVTWQEAIQAWADGKRVTLKFDRCEYAFFGFSDPENTRRAINGGTWYVED